jgi:hypothetical protein
MSNGDESAVTLHLGRKNLAFLGSAIISIAVGYVMLSQGSVSLAPILLVLGYCVLFPLGLVL